MAVRIKSEVMDVTLVTAYANTENTPQSKKKAFWQQLSTEIRGLPRRTLKIMGIDANGHVGRDTGPGLGTQGAEHWTFNGQQLQELVTATEMTAINTMPNCKHPGHTWFRRDGKGSGRIDYMVVDNRMVGNVCSNWGATEWEGIGRQGTPIDHKPVTCVVNFKVLQERALGRKGNAAEQGMSTNNEELKTCYENYIKKTNNQYRSKEKQIEVDEKAVKKCEELQEWVSSKLEEVKGETKTAENLIQTLDAIMNEAYWKFFSEKSKGKEKRKPFMNEETLDAIENRDVLWNWVRKLGSKLAPGWEEKFKVRQRNNRKAEEGREKVEDGQTQNCEENGTEEEAAWKAWKEWDTSKNRVRSMVRKNKIEYQKQVIEEIGQPEGESNIWKAVDKICFRKNKNKNKVALRRENGGWCADNMEEIEEVAKFCEKELKQKRWIGETKDEDTTEPDAESDEKHVEEDKEKENWQGKMQATTADVKEAFRKTHHSKANPKWSVPNKLWVIAEEQICIPLAEAWTKLGSEEFPTQWQQQLVAWIPKEGKTDGKANQRRGITVLDCGAKAYLTWLQKETGRKLNKFWSNDKRIEYGGMPGKGTAQAISKVLGGQKNM